MVVTMPTAATITMATQITRNGWVKTRSIMCAWKSRTIPTARAARSATASAVWSIVLMRAD